MNNFLKRNTRGAISIFILFILIPVMVFSSVLMDFARLYAIRSQAAATAETYANSYLSVYNEALNDLYGLFAIAGYDEDSEEVSDLIKALTGYMEAAYTPNKNKVEGLNFDEKNAPNAETLTQIEEMLKMKNGVPDSAMYLTGSALSDLNAVCRKPLVDTETNNFNVLQMQISEYIKFIGPTEIGFTAAPYVRELIMGKDESKKNEASGSINDASNILPLIERKNQINNKLSGINTKVLELCEAMKNYESKLKNYYNALKGIATGTKSSYKSAIGVTVKVHNKFRDVLKKEAYNGTAGVFLSDDDKKALKDVIKDEYYYDLVGRFYDGSNVSDVDNPLNMDNMKNNIEASDVEGYAEMVYWRGVLKTLAQGLSSFNTNLVNEINSLISDAERVDSDFANGLKDEYKEIRKPESESNPLYIINKYNFSQFGIKFDSYAKSVEETIFIEFNKAYISASPIGGQKNFYEYDSYLSSRYTKYTKLMDYLCGDSSKGIEAKSVDSAEVQQLITDLELNIDEPTKLVTVADFEAKAPNFDSSVWYPPFDGFGGVYEKYEDNEQSQFTFNGITLKKMYQSISKWKVEGAENNTKKDNIWAWINWVKKICDEVDNVANPVCTRTLPDYAGSVNVGPGMIKNGKVDFEELFNGGLQDFNVPSVADWGENFLNEVMLLMYDYGMFTCQTSDYAKDDKGKIIRKAPVSYQGITMAKKDGSRDTSVYGFEKSDTNYLLYNELEYIFAGNANAEDNFNTVMTWLTIIRFVPNYLTTYKLDELKPIFEAIRSVFQAIPYVGVVLGPLAEQAARIALAALETKLDLVRLYKGEAVAFFKTEIKHLSCIQYIVEHIDDCPAKDAIDIEKVQPKNQILAGKPGTESELDLEDDSKIQITYQQYLLVLTLIFVSRERMIERTAKLIEVNMNYYLSPFKDEDGFNSFITNGKNGFRLNKAFTSVTVTVESENSLVFIGDGVTSIFNTKNSDYDDLNEFSEEINGSTYKYSMTREY